MLNAKKQKLIVEYEILYNKEYFNPEDEITLCCYHPIRKEYVWQGSNNWDSDDFHAFWEKDSKNHDLENKSSFSCHENRTGIWDVCYDTLLGSRQRKITTTHTGIKIEKNVELFQLDNSAGADEDPLLLNWDKGKIGKLAIIKVNNFAVKDELIKEAKRHEELLEFDEAIEIYKKYGMDDDVIRIRKGARNQVSQTVVHGDYVDDRDTIVKDSVVNKSNIGGGGSSKMQELRELTEMKKEGLIDAAEFKQMKKEILGK